MAWMDDGSMKCDGCGTIFAGVPDDMVLTSQMARANGWSHGAGVNIGGDPYEAMVCRGCKGIEGKRIGRRPQGYDDTPLF